MCRYGGGGSLLIKSTDHNYGRGWVCQLLNTIKMAKSLCILGPCMFLLLPLYFDPNLPLQYDDLQNCTSFFFSFFRIFFSLLLSLLQVAGALAAVEVRLWSSSISSYVKRDTCIFFSPCIHTCSDRTADIFDTCRYLRLAS